MSVLVEIDVLITDLTALRNVCARMGLEFREHQREFFAYQTYPCSHAIGLPADPNRLKQPFEIGLIETRTAEGEVAYTMKMDIERKYNRSLRGLSDVEQRYRLEHDLGYSSGAVNRSYGR